jgi:hypothetical protein
MLAGPRAPYRRRVRCSRAGHAVAHGKEAMIMSDLLFVGAVLLFLLVSARIVDSLPQRNPMPAFRKPAQTSKYPSKPRQ